MLILPHCPALPQHLLIPECVFLQLSFDVVRGMWSPHIHPLSNASVVFWGKTDQFYIEYNSNYANLTAQDIANANLPFFSH